MTSGNAITLFFVRSLLYLVRRSEAHRRACREYDARNRESRQEYRARNRESNLRRATKWYRENSEHKRVYDEKYRTDNRERRNEQIREWVKTFPDKKRAADRACHVRNMRRPAFRLVRNLRNRVWHAIKGRTKSAHTVNLLGCSIPEFCAYLEKQFKPDMSWENYGEWHIDHIRPCASFNLSDPAQQQACFHFSNCQPLWMAENISKGAKYGCRTSS